MVIPSDIARFWRDEGNHSEEEPSSKRVRLEPSADVRSVAEYFQTHQDHFNILTLDDRLQLVKKLTLEAKDSNDPIVKLFTKNVIQALGNDCFKQAFKKGDYELALNILKTLPISEHEDIQKFLSTTIPQQILTPELCKFLIRSSFQITHMIENALPVLQSMLTKPLLVDDLTYLLSLNFPGLELLQPIGNLSLVAILEPDERLALKNASQQTLIKYLFSSERNRMRLFERMDVDHQEFLYYLQENMGFVDPSHEYLDFFMQKIRGILKQYESDPSTLNSYMLSQSAFYFAKAGRFKEAVELLQHINPQIHLNNLSKFYSLNIPKEFQEEIFRFGIKIDQDFFLYASPSSIQYAKDHELFNKGFEFDNFVLTYFKNSQYSSEVFEDLFGHILNEIIFSPLQENMLFDPSSPPDVALKLINQFKLTDPRLLKHCLYQHIQSYKLDVKLIEACLQEQPMTDEFFYMIISHPNYQQGDLFILKLFTSHDQRIIKLGIFKNLSLNALVDIYKIYPGIVDLNGESVLQNIVRKVKTFQKLLKTIEIPHLSLLTKDYNGQKPLDFLDPSQIEIPLELRTFKFSDLFSEPIFLTAILFKDESLFNEWVKNEPDLIKPLLKGPFFGITDLSSNLLTHLTNDEIWILNRFLENHKDENIEFEAGEAASILLDKSHPLFVGPLSETSQKMLEKIEKFVDHSPYSLVNSKDGNNILHYLMALRIYWLLDPNYTDETLYRIILKMGNLSLFFNRNSKGVSPFDLMIKSDTPLTELFKSFDPYISKSQLFELFIHFEMPPNDLITLFPSRAVSILNSLLSENYEELAQGLLVELFINNAIEDVVEKTPKRELFHLIEQMNYMSFEIITVEAIVDRLLKILELNPMEVDETGKFLIYNLIELGEITFIIKALTQPNFNPRELSLLSLFKIISMTGTVNLGRIILEKLEPLLKDPLLVSEIGSEPDVKKVFEFIFNKVRTRNYPLDEEFPFVVLFYNVDPSYTQVPIPDIVIPPKESNDNIREVISLFKTYCVDKKLSYIPRDDDKSFLTSAVLLNRLENLVKYIEQKKPYTGIPAEEADRVVFYNQLENALSWIVDLIKEEQDLDRIQSALIDIATGGPEGHCGTRWMSDVKAHYAILKRITLVETQEMSLYRFLSLVRGEDLFTMVRKRNYNIHYAKRLEFVIGQARGIPMLGTPVDDVLGGNVDPIESFVEFDSYHNEGRVFQSIYHAINDPLSSLESRANLAEWLKGFGEPDPRFPWIQEFPDSLLIQELKENLDDTAANVQRVLNDPYEESQEFKTFNRILDGIDWQKLKFNEFLSDHEVALKRKGRLDEVKALQTALMNQTDTLLLDDFLDWLFKQSSNRAPRTQMIESMREIDLKQTLVDLCHKDMMVIQSLFNALIEKKADKFKAAVLPQLNEQYKIKLLKDHLQVFGISEPSLKSLSKTDGNPQAVRDLLTNALVVLKRNEYYKTLFELDESGEIATFQALNRSIPHYKPAVALEILKRMGVLVQV